MIAEVSKGAAALREACAAEPAYQTADDLWKGLKRNDLAAQLVLTFAQRLRFNKRTRHSLPAAKRQEDKRWVRILRQEGWNLYLLMRQRAVPNRKKPGNKTGYLTQTGRRTKVRLGQADAAANTVDEQAAAALKATWSLVLSSCCVLWIDNWYRAQYTTHPDESDRSQNCTAMAVLQLKQRPTYWAGHPAVEDLEVRITTVARALQQRGRRIPQTLRDMGYADGCTPDTGNVRAPLDVRRDATTVQAPVWRPFALSKEKVTGGVGLLNLLHFAKDVAQQTNRVLPLLVDENIHYKILKLLYGAKNQRWNMRAYLRYVPVVYGVWHAYKFVVTHTFRVFWPILTYLRKGLLRPGSTILSYPKLIVMEKTIAALMLATPRILRLYRRKAQAATAISGRDTAHANRAAVANAVLHLLSECCPLLLYLGHVVRECNWSGGNNNTGSRAQEVLQLSLCLLRRLRRGPCHTVLKYESTIMCTLLYNSKWHQDLPGQAHSEEFGEGMLSKLVRDKARNTGSVTVEEVENHYLLLKVGPGGKRVGLQNVPKNLVHSMRQRLTRFLATDRICMAYVEWESARVSTVATSWPRRLPRFPPSPTQPLGYDHYWLLGHSVLDALIDQKTNPTNQLKRKLDAVEGQRTDMDADRQEAATRNVRQRLR